MIRILNANPWVDLPLVVEWLDEHAKGWLIHSGESTSEGHRRFTDLMRIDLIPKYGGYRRSSVVAVFWYILETKEQAMLFRLTWPTRKIEITE